jgi:hypothetical protein
MFPVDVICDDVRQNAISPISQQRALAFLGSMVLSKAILSPSPHPSGN